MNVNAGAILPLSALEFISILFQFSLMTLLFLKGINNDKFAAGQRNEQSPCSTADAKI
jgi:hypothetical protein